MQVHEVANSRVWLDSEGIVNIENDPKAELDVEDAKTIVNVVTQLGAGRKVPIWVDAANIKSMTRSARVYFAGEEAAGAVMAQAILVSSPIGKVISNFFLGLNKPPFPTKLFTSKEKSFAWLRSFTS